MPILTQCPGYMPPGGWPKREERTTVRFAWLPTWDTRAHRVVWLCWVREREWRETADASGWPVPWTTIERHRVRPHR